MLPALIPNPGNWAEYVEQLYARFVATLITVQLQLDGKPVRIPYDRAEDGKHEGFWHCITEEVNGERFPDFRRCERIGWIAWLIANVSNEAVIRINQKRQKNKRVLLMHRTEKFIVVLDERKTYFLLITAYVANDRNAEKYLKEFEAQKS